jgi:hypothetical protein
MDDHTHTTAGITLPATETSVPLTSTFLLDLSSITSELLMTVTTATTVCKSTDKDQCSSLTTETPTHNELFGHGISQNYLTKEAHMHVVV